MERQRQWGERLGRALAAGLLIAVVAAAGAGSGRAVAGADPIGSCSSSAGVLVAVDMGHWGGPVERGCDASTTTAYDALHRAGFTTAGDDTDGPAFVCRIDDRPTPAEQSCATTPPANAYWEFWYADAGATGWTYAPTGAMTFQPAPGSVEAWVFAGTHTGPAGPTFTPAEIEAGTALPPSPTTTVRRTTTTTALRSTTTLHPHAAVTTTTDSAATTTRPTVAAHPSTTSSTARPRTTTTTTAPTTATAPTTTGSSTTVSPTTVSSPTTALRIVAAGASPHGSSGPGAAGLAIGAVVVVGLGGAGLLVARRRRAAR